MNITHVLKCGDCPHYESIPIVGAPPEKCTHPDTAFGIAHPLLNGPSVMPPQCPMITNHTVYRAVRREMPR